ncbi:MAG: glutamate--tRNA ligase, partial [Alphaproteobacteria bacterium]|nr:glutamate--tRNA ligase [Alphaproteobacteria bacterium]
MTTVRFAPSPTGRIHIGNARTAILNWLFALKSGGEFILRYDDTDTARSTEEFARGIAEDLAWLGIRPHRVEHQSRRFARYGDIAARLKSIGRLYACYETADELDRRRKRQLARGLPPVYDRAALKLTDDDRARLEAEGRRPHWRFQLDGRIGAWNDLIRGAQHIDTTTLSDPVLVREDGTYLYTLPSVVDDMDFSVSHVIRGEDHVVNTAVQIEITEALGGTPPSYAHHSLLTGADGKGLSKRLGSLSIAGLRELGLEAMAVVSHAALLGTSDNIHPCADYGELVAGFDLDKLSRAPARFDEAELRHLNARLLHHLPWSSVRERLPGSDEGLWNALRGNIETLADSSVWIGIIRDSVKPMAEPGDCAFLAQAAAHLPPAPWTEETWKVWTSALKAETGRSGKSLFMPLRLALTGIDHGPEMARLL